MVGDQRITFQIGDDDAYGRQPFVDFLRKLVDAGGFCGKFILPVDKIGG